MDHSERSPSVASSSSISTNRPSLSPLTRPSMAESSSSGASSTFSYKPPSPSPLTPPLPTHLNNTTSNGLQASVLAPPPAAASAGSPFPTSSSAASSSAPPPPAAAPIVHFDPANPDASDDEDDDEDGGGARPKKKRRPEQLAAAGGASGSGSVTGEGGDEDPEKGRRKIDIAYIQKKEKRHITFSKRKAGIMKKAYELATLTGTQVLLLVVSETGIVYTFTTAKFQPLVGAGPGGAPSDGQRLIQSCLAVDPSEGSDYISPPPDGPLLPLPPSAINRPFEANSSIHGGQIALRTRAHRPGASHRSKPRPAAIRTQSAGANSMPPLPTPAVDHGMLLSPASGRSMHSMQHHQSQPGEYSPLPSVLQGSVGPRGEPLQSAQDYAEMMQGGRPPPQMGNMYQGGGNGPNGHLSPARIDPRMEQYQQGPPMEYGLPPQHNQPHPLMQHHSHSPDGRYGNSPGNSPLQQHPHLQHRLSDQQMSGNPNEHHRRQYSDEARQQQQRPMYGDDPNQERGPPGGNMYPPQGYHHPQQMQQDEYMMHGGQQQQQQGRR